MTADGELCWSQEGDELRRVWSRLVTHGRVAADWLGEEMKEVFTTRVVLLSVVRQ